MAEDDDNDYVRKIDREMFALQSFSEFLTWVFASKIVAFMFDICVWLLVRLVMQFWEHVIEKSKISHFPLQARWANNFEGMCFSWSFENVWNV